MSPNKNLSKINVLAQTINNLHNKNSIENTYIFIKQLLKFDFFSRKEISYAPIEKLLGEKYPYFIFCLYFLNAYSANNTKDDNLIENNINNLAQYIFDNNIENLKYIDKVSDDKSNRVYFDEVSLIKQFSETINQIKDLELISINGYNLKLPKNDKKNEKNNQENESLIDNNVYLAAFIAFIYKQENKKQFDEKLLEAIKGCEVVSKFFLFNKDQTRFTLVDFECIPKKTAEQGNTN